MSRKRKTVAEILASGNARHLSKAELSRRLAEEAGAARKAAVPTQPHAVAPQPTIQQPCSTVEIAHIDASAVCNQYALDVVEGRILAGKWVIAACHRFMDDIEHAAERGFYFSSSAAQKVVDYLGRLGLQLLPWQTFVVSNLFGWLKTEDNLRRFRTATIFCAKKQGKTTLLAGLGLYMADADGELAPEI